MLKLQSGKKLKELPNEKKENKFRQEESSPKTLPITYRGVLRRQKWLGNFNGRQNSGRGEKLGVFRRMRNNCFS